MPDIKKCFKKSLNAKKNKQGCTFRRNRKPWIAVDDFGSTAASIIWTFSWTEIRDTDSYSDTDSNKHDFHLSNLTLNDYWQRKPLSVTQGLLEALSLKLLCDLVSPSLPGQSDIPCFTMAIFSLRWLPLEAKLLKSHQTETKNL